MRSAVTRLSRRSFGFAGTPIKVPSDWDAAATQAIATARTHVDAINGRNRDPVRTLRRLDAVSVARRLDHLWVDLEQDVAKVHKVVAPLFMSPGVHQRFG